MARRFSFISNAKFNPFTFDEMAKPLLMYKEYYDKNEALATELAEKANEWEAKANAEQDGAAYEQVKKYADDLRGQAERLVKYGMSPGLRADLQTMKARYKGEVTPVEEAYNLRNKLAEEQRLASLKDPSLRFSKDYATASLADLLNNPTASYNQWSLNDIYNRSGNDIKALMAKSQRQPKLTKTQGGQEIWDFSSGYTDNDILHAVRNTSDPTSSGRNNVELHEHVQAMRNLYGYANMDDYQKEEFDNTLLESMMRGKEEHNYKMTSAPREKTKSGKQESIIDQQLKLATLAKAGFFPVRGEKGNIEGFEYKPEEAIKDSKEGKKEIEKQLKEEEDEAKARKKRETAYSKSPLSFQMWFDPAKYNPGTQTLKDFDSADFSASDFDEIYIPGYTSKDNLSRSVLTGMKDSDSNPKTLKQFNISEGMYQMIEKEVKAAGFTMDDVIIVKDTDHGRDDDYKIILRNRDINGYEIDDPTFWNKNVESDKVVEKATGKESSEKSSSSPKKSKADGGL